MNLETSWSRVNTTNLIWTPEKQNRVKHPLKANLKKKANI